MKNKLHPSIQKAGLICVLFSFLLVQNAFASGETNEKKSIVISKMNMNKFGPATCKTDSLKGLQSRATQKSDSLSVGTKNTTGASYNILFQVIYRNSFSDIFESGK
jgi:hypothetical protein